MIKRFWCWLWGHEYNFKAFTGRYGEIYDPVQGENIKVPILIQCQREFCDCCGKKNPDVES
jgi:hypothetical protein